MIIREGSRFIHAMPSPPKHRLLGLAASFTGPRGLAMWNPADPPPITSVTLCHGELDPRAGAGVRVISAAPSTVAVRHGHSTPDVDDAAFAALASLPNFTGEELETTAADLHRSEGSLLWAPLELTVDGTAVSFLIYHHRDRWWVAVAALHDIAVGVAATDTDPHSLELVTLDADIPGYEAAPALQPQVGHLADTRARLVVEGMEPVLMHHWAKNALAAGADTPALRQVLDVDLRDADDVRRTFELALDELGAPRLDDHAARWQYARYNARAAVDGELDATSAARRIVWGAADPLGHPARLRPFVKAVQQADQPDADQYEVEATCMRLVRELLTT